MSHKETKTYSITVPFSCETALELHAGDKVLLSGTIYTARDAAHKRLIEALHLGLELPIPLENQVIFYAGPTPPKPGEIVGSIGPTTSSRMDSLTPPLIEAGLRGMIGKGNRSEELHKVMIGRAVYFVTVGGAAALLSASVHKMEVCAYPELGPEAIYKLEVIDFPCYVAIDIHGHDLFQHSF